MSAGKMPDNDAAVSSSSEDDRSHKVRRGLKAPPAAPSAQRTPREQHLSDLLTRASEAIRSEREKVVSLEAENARLRAAASKAQPEPSGALASGAPQVLLRQRLQELALENFLAVEEIGMLRAKVLQLERQLSVQQVILSPMKQTPSPRRRSRSAQAAVGVAPAAQPHRRAAQHIGSPAPPSPSRSPPRMPPSGHHFDPMRSVQQSRQPTAVITTDVVALPATLPASYNEVMIHRLRRALAPPPTREQLGEVVHAMMKEMTHQLKCRGTVLQFKKIDHCVYQLDKRKLHLTIDSGRLVVKCGGGHVDLLEFLERNKVCVRASS